MSPVIIEATTDLHGSLTNDAMNQTNPLISYLHQTPAADTLRIDNGDFFTGSALASFYNLTAAGRPMVELANACHFDVMIPGNHDLEWGIKHLQDLTAQLQADYVCANLTDLAGNLLFQPYTIKQKGTVKIGVIGLITSFLSQILDFQFTQQLHILDVSEALQKYLPELRDQADYVIVAYHGGLECDPATGRITEYNTGEDQAYHLMHQFGSQMDGLICGHQHWLNSGYCGPVPFLQPGAHGQALGTFQLTTRLQQPQIINSTALPVMPSFTVPQYDAYLAWLKTSFNESIWQNFLKTYYAADFYQVYLTAAKWQNLVMDFDPIYALKKYQFSVDQGHQLFPQLQLQSPQKVITVLSNRSDLPFDRCIQQYVVNLLDRMSYFTQQQAANS